MLKMLLFGSFSFLFIILCLTIFLIQYQGNQQALHNPPPMMQQQNVSVSIIYIPLLSNFPVIQLPQNKSFFLPQPSSDSSQNLRFIVEDFCELAKSQ